MVYTFIATATKHSSLFTTTSNITVYQQCDDNTSAPVAYITDTCDPADHRQMTISFKDGTVVFEEAYDGPLLDHSFSPFINNRSNDNTISLHRFLAGHKSYLCAEDGFFPIVVEHNDGLFKISVYTPFSTAVKDCPAHSVFAVIIQTRTFDDGFHYEVHMDELPSLPLLLAIFSLPLLV